jgi:hypothetical protein
MFVRGGVRRREGRGLGIVLLILSLLHAPFPQPDFHNIRHHDAPGEICEHHDHLLRWHPGAGLADDVALLHWHWFLPTSGPTDASSTDDGPALHAHVSDWFASSWETGPQIAPDDHSRWVGRPALRLQATAPALLAGWSLGVPSDWGATRPAAPRASLAVRASMLQRWVC